jgi:hypothetical protein
MHPDDFGECPNCGTVLVGLRDQFGNYRGFCEHEDRFPDDDEHNA